MKTGTDSKKKKLGRKERLVIVAIFLLTIFLSLIFWLKAEVSHWYQDWQQPASYHIE